MDAASQDAGGFWSSFGRDPRVPDNQGLRAADRDRDIVREAITDAYADGRLTQDELDDRLSQVLEAKLLGDLPPVVADLLPATDVAQRDGLALAGPEEIDRVALARYKERRGQALGGMLVPSLICLTIWIYSMVSGPNIGFIFPWPLFVILGTGGYLWRLMLGRDSAIEEEREKIRKKQAKALAGEPESDVPAIEDDPEHRQDPEHRRDHWR